MDKKKFFEQAVSSPAVALEKTVEASQHVGDVIGSRASLQKARDFWHVLGPGLTTGASDDDPSGIATYSQTGAIFGLHLLWLSAFTLPLMAVVQEMCARIGLVTGRGLAANIRRHFPPWVLYSCATLLFIANAFNIGADLGAMAKGAQLLIPRANFVVLIIFFTVLSLALQIFSTYERYAKYLKWLALILLSYIFTAFLIPHLPWGEVMHAAVVPSLHFDRQEIIMICAILGTTISPYLFFWQTSQEVEEQILEGRTTIHQREGATNQEVSNMHADVWSGMVLSNLVMFFIILVCGVTLNKAGITYISTAAEAAEALRPLAGDQAFALFALGIIGTGMLAVPVLAGSSSYALAESLGWKQGLYRNLRSAYGFYGVIIISMLFGLAMNFVGIDPIKALVYSAVLNGLVAPVILILIVLLASNKKVMQERINRPFTTWLGWAIVGMMTVAGAAALFAFFQPS